MAAKRREEMHNRIAAVALCGLVAGTASAQHVIHATSFEAATGYTVGNLDGQQGWTGIPAANHGYSVTGDRANSGAWSVVQQFTGTGAFRASQAIMPEFTQGNYGYPALLARVDLYMDPGTSGSLFGLDFWSGGARVAATVVNASGQIFMYDQSTTSWINGTHAQIMPGEWLVLELQANFATNTSRAWVNGVGAASTGSFSSLSVTNVDLLTLRETSADTNVAYFDTFTLQAVPEPGTMAALCMGAGALLARRRKAAAR
jgi:hypothetical protein